jgi:thiol-disulfide isomerase/thioredoxin
MKHNFLSLVWFARNFGKLLLLGGLCLNGLALRGDDTVTAPTNSVASTNDEAADKAWKELRKAAQPPMPPEEWATKEPTREDQAAFYTPLILKAADLAKDFYTKYPANEKTADAKRMEYDLLTIATKQFGDTNHATRLATLETQRQNDPNLSSDEKFEMRMKAMEKLFGGLPDTLAEVQKSALALQKDFPDRPQVYQILLTVLSRSEGDSATALAKAITDGPAPDEVKEQVKSTQRIAPLLKLLPDMPKTLPEVEANLRALQKDFPDSPDVYQIMLMVMSESPADKAKAFGKEILDGPAPEQIKEQAKSALKQLEAVGKPLDVKFTAVDGREVDLTKMKGKVVLVDFWATWCGPCMGELPHVKAAYEKLHPQGFEIVGISFDEDKDALNKTLKEKEMTWAQYFDGTGWGNKYGKEFGIQGIPAMWLVDKQGNLRDINAREGLEGRVTKLLAE